MRYRILIAAAALAFFAEGCGRSQPTVRERVPLPVAIRADSGEAERWSVAPARARAWLERTDVVPIAAPVPSGAEAVPSPEPAAVPPEAAERPEADASLKPPLLRTPGRLIVPAAYANGRRGSVELDVRVDERGVVTDARPAGAGDTTLIEAARRSALGMSFYPALRGDRPVAVWCRQRFEFGPR
ncbi:MAG TPA: energy transducer TonB [Candidatus Udaeobacter sp.]|nr:energy transducer TonB [Candidatus Udaeobacter sp.]